MKELNTAAIALAAAGVLTSSVAQAALNDRGGGMLYDDVLKVTWLRDANYAKTSGYDDDGRMNWSAARTWAGNLVFGGYDDWRLAANTPVGADWNYYYSPSAPNGSTDIGYNITSPNSELSYMYYVNLGLKGFYSPDGYYQPNFGIFGNGSYLGGQADVGLVKNLQSGVYWSGTAVATDPGSSAWVFDTGDGDQDDFNHGGQFYAWAVRPGDVAAAVPEPETYAMLLAGLGLLGMAGMQRRRSSGASNLFLGGRGGCPLRCCYLS